MSLPDSREKDQLVLFSELKKDPVIKAFFAMLEDREVGNAYELNKSAARFAGRLYQKQTVDWSRYLLEKVITTPNCLSGFAKRKETVPRQILDSLFSELDYLQLCSQVSPEEIAPNLQSKWMVSEVEIRKEYLHRLLNINRYGTRPFSDYIMFRLEEKKGKAKIKPIYNADPIRLKDLWGYETQHERMVQNIKSFLDGDGANNILLYGAAGTGKSASVKAVVNEFNARGLRLLEVDKDHLKYLPDLMDQIRENPLKFVVFIDDLSFGADDDRYALLKAVLEGSGSAQAENALIIATSNRRHVIKESIDERKADLHEFDHLQEMTSLSDRFGLQIPFERPDKKDYLEIVRFYLEKEGIQLEPEDLEHEAERYALGKGNRSARSARQLAQKIVVERNRNVITG